MERNLDEHIRIKLNPDIISVSQHAYVKGKYTETALRKAVHTVESFFELSTMLVKFLSPTH